MSKQIKLNAETRTDLGKGASRRLRRTGNFPAVAYGAGEPQSLTMVHKDFWKAQEDEAFYASILSLSIDGKECKAVIKDIQRHPAKSIVLHADFQRIDENQTLTINVPLHFINTTTCPGVKLDSGVLQYQATLLKIRCLPKALPEYIEVDLIELASGDTVHISDIKLPEGVESVDLSLGADHDLTIVQVITPRGISDEDEAESEGESEGDDAEATEGEAES